MVRAGAITIGPPRLPLCAFINFLCNTTTCKLFIKPPINQITLKLKMENPLWSSPPREGEQGDWKTPPRKTVRIMALQGKSDHMIRDATGIPRSTVQRIRKQESSRRLRKGKVYKPRMMTVREIRQAIRHLSKDYASRHLTFERLRAQLGIQASACTIR